MTDFSSITEEQFNELSSDELAAYLNWLNAGEPAASEDNNNGEEPIVDDPVLVDEENREAAPAPVQAATPAPVQSDLYGAIPATTKIEEALVFSGLDYAVETFQLKPELTGVGLQDGSPEPDEDWLVPRYVGIRRQDDRKAVFGIVFNTYKIVQNAELLEFVTPLLDATGGEFTRVGSFLNGARVFAVITLDEAIPLPGGRSLKQELLINSSHDGAVALNVRSIATLNGTVVSQGQTYKLRHTRNVHIRATEVIKILEIKNRFFTDLADKVSQLDNISMTDEEAQTFLKAFLEFPEQEDITVHAFKVDAKDGILKEFRAARASGNTRLEMILAIAHYENNCKPVKNTKKFRSTAETRFKNVLTGTSGDVIEQAWRALLQP
jgi:hypothetical protein